LYKAKAPNTPQLNIMTKLIIYPNITAHPLDLGFLFCFRTWSRVGWQIYEKPWTESQYWIFGMLIYFDENALESMLGIFSINEKIIVST
jgi:hypothetical protein